jgi:predicted  nucleic acid-binding Zn-ribbon protein
MLALVESVRCLECGSVYAKPRGGGTVQQNPGCPDCGYVGWLSVTLPLNERRRRRSASGPLQRLRAQPS